VTTAVVVQARIGSTRLPGKTLMPLRSTTVLEEVLRRCQAVPGSNIVVCAIPDDPQDNPVVSMAARAGAVVVRGSAEDVLGRYLTAAETVNADVVMRVTSDCPLIDPQVCGEVLTMREAEDADYACNNMPPSFPHGLDCEAFTMEALRRAASQARGVDEREHVTPWLRTSPDVRRVNLAGPGGEVTRHRWTLDYPEDYTFLTRLFDLLPPAPAIPAWRNVVDVLAGAPQLAAVNAMRRVR
jgi:spore coat polysaccharide biosynthesis protein SpsF